MTRERFAGPAPEALMASASEGDQEERQRRALSAVSQAARMLGRQIPVLSGERGIQEMPGLYVIDPEVRAKGGIRAASFQVEPKMLRGAADSAHAVLAGDMSVTYDSGQVSTTQVAAKCFLKRDFLERMDRVQREVSITQTLAARGDLALAPIAVAVAPANVADQAIILFTRLQEGLYTLDGNPWGRGLTPRNIAIATAAAGAVGHFNAQGGEHKDAKIKNVATLPFGQAGMIDFETSGWFDPTDPAQAATAAHADLGLLMDSLGQKGLFRSRSYGTRDQSEEIAAAVRDICERGYLPAWQSAPADVQLAVYDVVGGIGQSVVDSRAPMPVPL